MNTVLGKKVWLSGRYLHNHHILGEYHILHPHLHWGTLSILYYYPLSVHLVTTLYSYGVVRKFTQGDRAGTEPCLWLSSGATHLPL